MTRSIVAAVLIASGLLVVGQARSEDFARRVPLLPVKFEQTDWPWWRGAERNGHASPEQTPPLTWNETENVVWKVPVPGRGHGSPTVVGTRVFLATAEEDTQVQSMLCFERTTGKQLWKTGLHKGGFPKKSNKKATMASSSAACDGERGFINFLHDGAVYTTAMNLDGQQLWQTKITDYILHQGYGSSPAIYGSTVIVSADNKAGGKVAALDRQNGKLVWEQLRPKTPNYPSPIILKAAGREQLFLTGCNLVTSYDPKTGEKLWELDGATTECVTSTVTDGNVIITSGGYPKNHMSAFKADGSQKEPVWENQSRVYVPSMLIRDGYLYSVLDAGIAACWKVDTGEEVWKERLGGTFSSSPVLVGENIFATSEDGRTHVFKASPSGFESVGESKLGDEVFATPTICGNRIYVRVAHQNGDTRQEVLYCLGN
ncbi:MAG: PQQ-binding-like beta-propeller repeat protein [Planctomycetota bacterium]|nr:PQQ-binding-like beta-propeller repeat protein [Planctomycetota bacterium]